MTPSGTPASTKPMKSGTAEQEQKGVTIPNEAAATVPASSAAAGEGGPHSLRREEAPDQGDGRDDAEQQEKHLRHVEEEERDRLAELRSTLEAEKREGRPLGERRVGEPGGEPRRDRNPDHEGERQTWPAQGERRHPSTSPIAAAAAAHAASSRS